MPLGANTCERWVFEFQKQLALINPNSRCYSLNFTCPKVTGSISTSAHAVIDLTFCNGDKIQLDNGAFGGGDHIIPPGNEVPPIINL